MHDQVHGSEFRGFLDTLRHPPKIISDLKRINWLPKRPYITKEVSPEDDHHEHMSLNVKKVGLGNKKPHKSQLPCKRLMTIVTYRRGRSVLVCSRGEEAPGPKLSHLENSNLGWSLQNPWKYWKIREAQRKVTACSNGIPPQANGRSVATILAEKRELPPSPTDPPILSASCKCLPHLVVGVFVKSWSTNWPHCIKGNQFKIELDVVQLCETLMIRLSH